MLLCASGGRIACMPRAHDGSVPTDKRTGN
jgi:hypothetical protein